MKISKLIKITAVMVGLSIAALSAHATDWVVDNNNSQLNFISIKKTDIAEIHEFKQLQGGYDEQGQFTLNIDLASVDTHIPVRDDRMKNYFFDVSQFSTAKITATIDTDLVDAIAEGASQRFAVEANLDLHGVIKPLTLDVVITRLVGARLSVVSVQPVIVNANEFALTAGLNKLMELAALPSISQAVPVNFYLTLKLK